MWSPQIYSCQLCHQEGLSVPTGVREEISSCRCCWNLPFPSWASLISVLMYPTVPKAGLCSAKQQCVCVWGRLGKGVPGWGEGRQEVCHGGARKDRRHFFIAPALEVMQKQIVPLWSGWHMGVHWSPSSDEGAGCSLLACWIPQQPFRCHRSPRAT